MVISNFTVTPGMVAPGERMLVQFTVTVEEGDRVNGLSIVGGPEQRVLYFDNEWRLDVGQSADVVFESVVPTNNKYINSSLAASDAGQFTVPYWYIILGEFGTRVDIPDPVIYADKGLYPAINVFTLERAAGDQLNDEGEDVLASVRISAGPHADISAATLILNYTDGMSSGAVDLTDKIPELLEGVADSPTLITQKFSNTNNWRFKLVFGNGTSEASLEYLLPRAFANVHLSGDERGGVCFGGFSHGMGAFESYYPAFFYGGIEGVTNYAEMEVPTGGTWIDGKPIYRKIVSMEVNKANTWFFSEGDNAIENFDSLVHVDYKYYLASGSILHGSTFYDSNMYLRLYCSVTAENQWRLVASYVGSFPGTARAIVYYTKLEEETDEGGSGELVEIIRPAAAMTSASSQGCVASASSENSTSYAAWKAFNKSNSDAYGWASKQVDSNKWIQLKMDVALTNITVTIANRAGSSSIVNGIVSGTIQGSNDGSTWVNLCTISGRDGATVGKASIHECSNETAYSYIRIKSASSTNNSYVAVGEITIKGYAKEG